jgi:hypothetical protein
MSMLIFFAASTLKWQILPSLMMFSSVIVDDAEMVGADS